MSTELEQIRKLREEIDAQAQAARAGQSEQPPVEAEPEQSKDFPWHLVGYGALGLAGVAVLLFLLKQLIIVAIIAAAGYVGYRWIRKSMGDHDDDQQPSG